MLLVVMMKRGRQVEMALKLPELLLHPKSD
jgi:hypothetical protein